MKSTDGPSPCGYHFISEYLKCPRKWYLRYYELLEPKLVKTPLLFGHAWHVALETLLRVEDADTHRSRGSEQAVQAGLKDLELNRSRMAVPDDYLMCQERIEKGIPLWFDEFRKQFPTWFVHSVEDSRLVQLADDLKFSVRMDAVVLDFEGRPYVMEHKTTGWSTDKTVQGVELGDQVTGYYLAYNKTRPANCPNLAGVLLDVTEFKATGIKPSFWILTRTHDDQVNMELGLVGLFNELNQKVTGLDEGYPPFALFPRSSEFCALFGCEYESICRSRIELGTLPPTEDYIVKAIAADDDSEPC